MSDALECAMHLKGGPGNKKQNKRVLFKIAVCCCSSRRHNAEDVINDGEVSTHDPFQSASKSVMSFLSTRISLMVRHINPLEDIARWTVG